MDEKKAKKDKSGLSGGSGGGDEKKKKKEKVAAQTGPLSFGDDEEGVLHSPSDVKDLQGSRYRTVLRVHIHVLRVW